MTFEDLYPLLYKTIVYLTVPAAVGFPIWYHLRLRWHSSEIGRHVMGYSVVVALLYLVSILRFTWPGIPLQRVITLVMALAMMVVVWWRVVVFVHLYRKGRRTRNGSRPQAEDPPADS